MKIIRISVLFVGLIAAPLCSSAQAFADGTNLVSIGFGLPPGTKLTQTYDPNPSFTVYKLKNYGTGILRYEHGLNKYFGIGLNLEYSASSNVYDYDNNSNLLYSVTVNRSVFGGYLRMNGHFPVGDKLDFYAGVGLGYLYTVDNTNDSNPNTNLNTSHKNSVLDFDWQASVGARYMVKNGFGVFAEIGYATTLCQVGVTLKF
jgi:opacity protein-like surface antigen